MHARTWTCLPTYLHTHARAHTHFCELIDTLNNFRPKSHCVDDLKHKPKNVDTKLLLSLSI